MADTTSANSGSSIHSTVSAQIVLKQASHNVAWDKVLNAGPDKVQGSRTYDFSDFTTSVTMGSITEAAGTATNAATTARQASLGQRGGATYLSDLVKNGNPTFSSQLVDQMAIDAGADIDALVTALFSSVATSVGATATAITTDTFRQAKFNLSSNDAPMTLAHDTILGTVPSGLYGYLAMLGPAGVAQLDKSIGNASSSQLANPAISRVVYENGMVSPGFQFSYLNIPVFQSTNVPDDATDETGCMFSPAAFGFAWNQLGEIETARGAAGALKRSDLFTLTSDVGVVEVHDLYAVAITGSNSF